MTSPRRLISRLLAVATVAPVLTTVAVTSAGASTGNPGANLAPTPDYWVTCNADGAASSACRTAELAAINHAHAVEGVRPMVLPTDFASLTTAEQTFVVSNLERVDRGLRPAAGLVSSLNSLAAHAAVIDADPIYNNSVPGLSLRSWGSNWAGDLNALAADYDWMYEDGPGGGNIDCVTASSAGCWGHRDNILGSYASAPVLVSGTGALAQTGWTSIAQIFVAGTGSMPAFTYSWASAVANGADGGQQSSVAPVTSPASLVRGVLSVKVTSPTKLTTTVTPAVGQTLRLYRRSGTSYVLVGSLRMRSYSRIHTWTQLRAGYYKVVLPAYGNVSGTHQSVTLP